MRKFLVALGRRQGLAVLTAVAVLTLGALAWFQAGDWATVEQVSDDRSEGRAVAALNQGTTSQNIAQTQSGESEAGSPEAPQAEGPDTTTAARTAAKPVDALTKPAFDEVRRDADGVTVIAGRAAPGARVDVMQNGVAVATATADGNGKFAALTIIPPDGTGKVLSLRETSGDREQASDDQIILAPTTAPDLASAAEPKIAPQIATGPVPDAIGSASSTSDDIPPADAAAKAEVIPATQTPATLVAVAPQVPPAPATGAATAAATPPAQVSPQPKLAAAQPLPKTTPAPVADVVTGPTDPPKLTGTTDQPGTPAADAKSTVVELSPTTMPPAPSETAPTQPAAVAVLKSTPAGVELLNAPRPEVMDAVALDTISYSDAGDVQLAGRAQAQAQEVRVYLDNKVLISLPVDGEGRWRGDLPDVGAGIYTLRVDEVAADGSVSSRVETPFKRESVATLAAASVGRDGPISAITVQKGATLWAIARDRYGDGLLYVRVFEANAEAIRNPDLIYPGQVFDLPD